MPSKCAAKVAHFLRAYRLLHEHGILPASGGWLDQTSAFIEAIEVIDGSRGK